MNIKAHMKITTISTTYRVYCKVIGKIDKGDEIYVSHIAGVGSANHNKSPNNKTFVGYACENYDKNSIGKIKVILRK